MSDERATKGMSNKRPKKRSKVWQHFDETLDGQRAICKYCNNNLSANSKGGTSHLNRHLTTCQKCPKIAVNQSPTLVSSNEARNIGLTRDKPWEGSVNKSSLLSFEKTKNAIMEEIPIASLDRRKLWHDLMGPIDIEKEIFAYYEHAKEKLAIELKNLPSRVSFSFEIVQKLGYISITAHFINGNFNLMRKLIGFKKITDLQSESCMVDAIESCISEWKLGDKIFTFVGGDNSSDMKKSLLEKFSSKMLLAGKYINEPCCKEVVTDLYCYCIGPLCCQDYANINKTIKEVKEAPSRMAIFNNIAEEKDLTPINIDWLNEYTGCSWDVDSKDVEHWKPTIKMFKEAVIYENVFNQYKELADRWMIVHEGGLELNNAYSNLLDNINSSRIYTHVEAGQPPLSELNMCSIDWLRVRTANSFSGVCFRIIEDLSNLDYPTSSLYIPNLYELEFFIDKLVEDIEIETLSGKKIYSMYDKYLQYGKLRDLFVIANALDPRFKLTFSEYYWKYVNELHVWSIDEHKKPFEEIFYEYAEEEMKEASPTCSESTNTQDQETASYSMLPRWPHIVDFYHYVKEEVNEKKELLKYLGDELVDLSDASFDLLGWWKQNRLRYPILSRMARDILAVPSCVYSIEGIISSKFELLKGASPELLEAVICSKDWILSDMQRTPEPNN